MKQVYEPGAYVSWIHPPNAGIDNKPGDFEYVKIALPLVEMGHRYLLAELDNGAAGGVILVDRDAEYHVDS